MPLQPYVYVSTDASKDLSRKAPNGARVAIHYPELGRTVEIETDARGRWTVTDRPAPGIGGPSVVRAVGTLSDDQRGGE